MPEGPEVRVIADCLRKLLVGKQLLQITTNDLSRYRNGIPRYSDVERYLPLSVLDVTTRGKKIIFSFSGDLEEGREIYLVVSLGMEGRFVLIPDQHSGVQFDFNDEERDTVIDLYFSDSRHFGLLEFVIGKDDLCQRLKDIGPDILQEEISSEKWREIVRNPRLRKKTICDFLLDQKRVSGIGNYLRAEILYRARIRPDRRLSELTDEELERIRVEAIQTARESYIARGLTIKSYCDLTGNKGSFVCSVYKQKTDPSGNPVVAQVLTDGRTMYWVPALQH